MHIAYELQLKWDHIVSVVVNITKAQCSALCAYM